MRAIGTTTSLKSMPSQKKSTAQKSETWAKECIDAAESMVFYQTDSIRQSKYNMKINYDLVNGILDPKDMEKISNPTGIKNATFPATPKNYPITNPKLMALKGEELKRRFDYKVIVVNEDAISEKEEAKKAEVFNFIREKITAQNLDEETLQKELEKLDSKLRYEWQDIREMSATRLLTYYYKHLDLKAVFNRGWEDALIAGEEIYCIDEVNKEPVVRKCNPLNLYCLVSPESPNIDDCDIIVEETYLPLGQVIDTYYEHLSPKEITALEEGSKGSFGASSYGKSPLSVAFKIETPFMQDNDLIDPEKFNQSSQGSFDQNGNIRVIRAVWRSLRRIGILTYFDENGDEQETDVAEEYTPDITLGEKIRYIWIGEFWEGTKIANEFYIKMKPRSIQFRRMDNKSYCSSGYVGSVYNTNSNRAQSLFDLMKQYQYLYNAYMYRTELAMIKAIGRIGVLDLAMIPDDWNVDTWMHFATNLGWAVKDSFKEAKKGAATGKIVGNMSGSADHIDLSQGDFVQQNMAFLQYIEKQLDTITGITPQREGQVSASAGLGTTQQATEASRTITEPYFFTHEEVKIRVMKALLETAKYCLKNGSKKLQNILDDMSVTIYTIDGEQLNEAEYGLICSNSAGDAELMRAFKELAHAGIQNNKISFTQLMDIYSNESMSAVRRKIQGAEEAVQQQQQQAEEAQREHESQLAQMAQQQAQAELEARLQAEEADRQLKQYEIDTNNQTKIQVAEINVFSRQENLDLDNDGIPDPVELASLSLQERELSSKAFMEQSKLANDNQKHAKELSIKEKELRMKREIEDAKIEAIRVQNKSQELMQDKDHKLKEKEIAAKMQIEKIKLQAAKAKARQAKKPKSSK